MQQLVDCLEALSNLSEALKKVPLSQEANPDAYMDMACINVSAQDIGRRLAVMVSRDMELTFDTQPNCPLTQDERYLARNPANRILVIKMIRQRTGWDLRTAKDTMDDWGLKAGMATKREDGSVSWHGRSTLVTVRKA